jgi:antitoxin Phd
VKWQLQDAKNKLSQVVKEANESGPQVITVHGKEAAVVVSAEDYRKLTHTEGTLLEFFQKSPLWGVELDLTRSTDTGREIDL